MIPEDALVIHQEATCPNCHREYLSSDNEIHCECGWVGIALFGGGYDWFELRSRNGYKSTDN